VTGPRLDIIDEAQRERDTTEKKPEDPATKAADIREFPQQTRKPVQASASNAPAGRTPTEGGASSGVREPRIFDINKAFEELDDIKSKIGTARPSKPRVVAPNNGQKQPGQKPMNSPSETLKSQLIGRDATKTAPYKMAESMRLPSNGDDQMSEESRERPALTSWSAVSNQEAGEPATHQPEWDSHHLISPGKQEQLSTSLFAEGKHEAPRRNLENIMTNKKPSQPVVSMNSDLSSPS
jgi:hypothetical protein